MTHMRIKLAVVGIVLLASLGYLGFAGVRDGWVYYLDVDQFLADAKYHADRVRLCGRVDEEGLAVHRGRLVASFSLLGSTQSIAVAYKGVIPDAFTAGGDVVVEGQLDEQGTFQADVLMTKCASKYQAEEHAKRLEEGA